MIVISVHLPSSGVPKLPMQPRRQRRITEKICSRLGHGKGDPPGLRWPDRRTARGCNKTIGPLALSLQEQPTSSEDRDNGASSNTEPQRYQRVLGINSLLINDEAGDIQANRGTDKKNQANRDYDDLEKKTLAFWRNYRSHFIPIRVLHALSNVLQNS